VLIKPSECALEHIERVGRICELVALVRADKELRLYIECLERGGTPAAYRCR
jgi:hypothetical protein